LSYGARINDASKQKDTPLMLAAVAGHLDTVKVLLKNGADVRMRNENGLTAVDMATRSGNTQIADEIKASTASKKGLFGLF